MSRVHIELQRVQSWLFGVPRLRAMVGANTLLGETLRVKLRDLARGNSRWELAPLSGPYPTTDPNDPLGQHDDPSADARDGVLSRDGGHFEAQFASGAQEFADAAAGLICRELPGLRFRIWIDDTERQVGRAHLSTELPVLMPCKWTGRGLASAIIQQGDDRAAVSFDVARRHEAARRAEDGSAQDLASLLGRTTKLAGLQRAQELQDLVGEGYLALIQADGNGVGNAAGTDDVERAMFFHRNRVLLRRALKEAIDTFCHGKGQAPLIPLMLGGDDLLLVCRAEIALPFVATLCERLAAFQRGKTNGFELTLGIGVVIAKHTIPIHRLHEVAERLAGSAKRRFRGHNEVGTKAGSVVDWAVYTTAWVDDPEELRRCDWVCGTDGDHPRVLSQRPVDVLGEGLHSLHGLVEAAKKLQGAPRSQLRYLVEQVARGRALTELAFKELSAEARTALKAAGVDAPWRRASGNGPWLTDLLDLVEIAEIARLGQGVGSAPGTMEAAHG